MEREGTLVPIGLTTKIVCLRFHNYALRKGHCAN